MTPSDIERLISTDPELSPHRDYILSIARPSVTLTVDSNGPSGTQSRLGGDPMVPPDFQWPRHAIGDYWFLGHIDFAEIEQRPASLPDSGVLALFYAQDDQGEVFWGDDGYILGYYWPDPSALVHRATPHAKALPARRIHLHGALDLPRHDELREDWPFDSELLDPITDTLPHNYLLGYPSHCSLGYDPTPGTGWCNLLTLDSLDQFHWYWHDGDKLMVFIQNEKLAARDFSHLKSDAG